MAKNAIIKSSQKSVFWKLFFPQKRVRQTFKFYNNKFII